MNVSSVCVWVFQMKQRLVCVSFNTYFECGLALLTFKEKSSVTLKLGQDHTQPDQQQKFIFFPWINEITNTYAQTKMSDLARSENFKNWHWFALEGDNLHISGLGISGRATPKQQQQTSTVIAGDPCHYNIKSVRAKAASHAQRTQNRFWGEGSES